MSARDKVATWEVMSPEQQKEVLDSLSMQLQAELFDLMDSDKDKKALLDHLSTEDQAELFEEMSEDAKGKMRGLLGDDDRLALDLLLNPEVKHPDEEIQAVVVIDDDEELITVVAGMSESEEEVEFEVTTVHNNVPYAPVGTVFLNFRVSYAADERPPLLRMLKANIINKQMQVHGGASEEFWCSLEKLSFLKLQSWQNRCVSWCMQNLYPLRGLFVLFFWDYGSLIVCCRCLHHSRHMPPEGSEEADQLHWRLVDERPMSGHSGGAYFVCTRKDCNSSAEIQQLKDPEHHESQVRGIQNAVCVNLIIFPMLRVMNIWCNPQVWTTRLQSCVGVWIPEHPAMCFTLDRFGRWTLNLVHQGHQPRDN